MQGSSRDCEANSPRCARGIRKRPHTHVLFECVKLGIDTTEIMTQCIVVLRARRAHRAFEARFLVGVRPREAGVVAVVDVAHAAGAQTLLRLVALTATRAVAAGVVRPVLVLVAGGAPLALEAEGVRCVFAVIALLADPQVAVSVAVRGPRRDFRAAVRVRAAVRRHLRWWSPTRHRGNLKKTTRDREHFIKNKHAVRHTKKAAPWGSKSRPALWRVGACDRCGKGGAVRRCYTGTCWPWSWAFCARPRPSHPDALIQRVRRVAAAAAALRRVVGSCRHSQVPQKTSWCATGRRPEDYPSPSSHASHTGPSKRGFVSSPSSFSSSSLSSSLGHVRQVSQK